VESTNVTLQHKIVLATPTAFGRTPRPVELTNVTPQRKIVLATPTASDRTPRPVELTNVAPQHKIELATTPTSDRIVNTKIITYHQPVLPASITSDRPSRPKESTNIAPYHKPVPATPNTPTTSGRTIGVIKSINIPHHHGVLLTPTTSVSSPRLKESTNSTPYHKPVPATPINHQYVLATPTTYARLPRPKESTSVATPTTSGRPPGPKESPSVALHHQPVFATPTTTGRPPRPKESTSVALHHQPVFAVPTTSGRPPQPKVETATPTTIKAARRINFNVADDGLEYALGFIARKFNKKAREKGSTSQASLLGDYSYKASWDHDYCVGGSYVAQLSHGGLTIPENKFLVEGRSLNLKLQQLHGDTFKFRKEIVKQTVLYLQQFSNLQKEILISIVKLFIKFRIVRLNRESRTAIKRRAQEQRAKSAAKLKKLC
jgi:hypothetical protein